MELSSHEAGIPIPLNSTFGHGHGHLIHHDHPVVPHNHNNIISSTAPQIPSSNNGTSITTASIDDNHVPYKKMVRYRECLKNHAASMGGNATDGCGEFMPSGEEGSIEALTCSACNCHRNFHRKEIEGEHTSCTEDHCYHNSPHFNRVGRKVILGHHKSILAPEALGYPTATGTLIPSRASAPHHQMIMSYNMGSLPSESDEQEDGGTTRPSAVEDKFNFLLSGAFDTYRLSGFWFGTNSLDLGREDKALVKSAGTYGQSTTHTLLAV
ncbi:hypothetical protein POTOM_016458 [Populus tomentosa]|uniref:ZF-HD dimerization-type domain-containing protein n=1 Tax=Populus tomentosa TaxID=118781 RepID=A0A8X8D6W9_POPTO|nr:hypothetical protein POTOM_016458 [Populus tomentosa]